MNARDETTVKRYLDVGGGTPTPRPESLRGFQCVSLDIDPTLKPDVLCDAREMTTLPAGEYDVVLCSHNLEHFYFHDLPKVLAGILHVLKPDGFAMIAVPSVFAAMANAFSRGMDLEDVLYQSPVGPIKLVEVIYGARQFIDGSNDFMLHKNAFSERSLKQALQDAGFLFVLAETGPIFQINAVAFKAASPTPEQVRMFEGGE